MIRRVVVIGASAAGLRAAARAKRRNPELEIVVLDRREIISLGACGLPYYVSGDLDSLEPLRTTPWGALRDAEFFRSAKGLDVRVRCAVTAIDCEERRVHCRDLDSSKEETLDWDRLVIATGARPRTLPGISPEHPRVSSFTTAEEALRWREALQRGQLESIAIIGAGLIGIELAEAFSSLWGCEVTLIESLDRVLGQLLDTEMSALVQAHLEQQGVRVHTGRRCLSLEECDGALRIDTDAGVIETQHAICAIGFEPEVELAREAGLAIGGAGGIAVDELLRTSDPRVFAAGDCIEVHHRVSDQAVHLPLGSLANRQGRVVGDNLTGLESRFGAVVGSSAVKAFELNVAAAGLSEGACERLGVACESVYGTFSDKAAYHPDDEPLHMKLVFTSSELADHGGRLLGLQVVGRGDAVKRVDVFANLLHRGGRVDDLLELEFCYAPPFAPALDPLYALGCAALNQVRDGVRCAPPDRELDPPSLVDVRTASEAEAAPLEEGGRQIPLEQLRARLGEVAQVQDPLVYCSRGARSAEAARVLLQNGHPGVRYLGGGISMRVRPGKPPVGIEE